MLFRERDLLGLGAQLLLGGGHPEGDRVVFPFDWKLHSRQGFFKINFAIIQRGFCFNLP